MPVFSIIIPVYKVEEYIRQCVESIINQTFTDFEAIFVDDYGGDNSIKIVEEYAQNDKRIKIFYLDKNSGVSVARNTAMKKAQGKYTICLDPDDWLENNSLEILYNTCQKRNVDAIWFDGNKYYEDSKTIDEKSVIECKEGNLTLTPQNISDLSSYSCFKVYKTKNIQDNDIFWPEGISLGEDTEFYYKYFSLFPDAYIIENRLYNYRIHNNSAVTNFHRGFVNLNDLFEIIKNLKNFYINNNLYEKYKITLLKLLQIRIDTARVTPNKYEEALVISRQLLDEFNFPDEFPEFNIQEYPLISIILTINKNDNYNSIINFIKRIQIQSYKNTEIICINKNPIISKIQNKIIKKDSRIVFIENTDTLCTKGEYVFYTDIEKPITRFCVENMLNNIKKMPQTYIKTEKNYLNA